MVLFCLVASHRTVDLNTVARLSTGALGVAEDAVSRGALAGAITLSTCNRLELYGELPEHASVDVPGAQQELAERIARRAGLDERFVLETMDAYEGPEVPRHLFTVVSGLESAVVGEREITGQVRRALAGAQQSGTASPHLVQLFEAAALTARASGVG